MTVEERDVLKEKISDRVFNLLEDFDAEISESHSLTFECYKPVPMGRLRRIYEVAKKKQAALKLLVSVPAKLAVDDTRSGTRSTADKKLRWKVDGGRHMMGAAVRRLPKLDSIVETRLKNGDIITEIARRGPWIQHILRNKKKGWTVVEANGTRLLHPVGKHSLPIPTGGANNMARESVFSMGASVRSSEIDRMKRENERLRRENQALKHKRTAKKLSNSGGSKDAIKVQRDKKTSAPSSAALSSNGHRQFPLPAISTKKRVRSLSPSQSQRQRPQKKLNTLRRSPPPRMRHGGVKASSSGSGIRSSNPYKNVASSNRIPNASTYKQVSRIDKGSKSIPSVASPRKPSLGLKPRPAGEAHTLRRKLIPKKKGSEKIVKKFKENLREEKEIARKAAVAAAAEKARQQSKKLVNWKSTASDDKLSAPKSRISAHAPASKDVQIVKPAKVNMDTLDDILGGI
eukprot:CAMPEP_0184480528 /NCGR_PEP_ID=MMETSP0113_2-20130426/2035_1 /TAXON_ID=91329 /ORGANISM="Norrisiella sphaerica, Strain BC52" /LENGTH=458 /DNA_ID=CAMNT_0026859069 /DNA_START=36 /DNA_END=1412 /DNA_ORIENTATION=+